MRATSCRGLFAVVFGLAAGCDTAHETAFSAKLDGGWARRFKDVTVTSSPRDAAAIFAATDTTILKIDPFGEVVTRPSRARVVSLQQDAQALRAWITTADSNAKNSRRSTRIDAAGETLLAQGVDRVKVEPTPDGEVVWTWTLLDDVTVLRHTEAGVTTELEQADPSKVRPFKAARVQGLAASWEIDCADPAAGCTHEQLYLRRPGKKDTRPELVADDVRWHQALDGVVRGVWFQTAKGLAYARLLDGRVVTNFITFASSPTDKPAPVVLSKIQREWSQSDEYDGLWFNEVADDHVELRRATADGVRSWILPVRLGDERNCPVVMGNAATLWAYCAVSNGVLMVYRLALDGRAERVFSGPRSAASAAYRPVMPGYQGVWIWARNEVRFVPNDPALALRPPWSFASPVRLVMPSEVCVCAWIGVAATLRFVDVTDPSHDWQSVWPDQMEPIGATTHRGHAWLERGWLYYPWLKQQGWMMNPSFDSDSTTGLVAAGLVAIGPASDLHVTIVVDAATFDLGRVAPILRGENFKLDLKATVGPNQVPLELVEAVVKIVDRTAKTTPITHYIKQGDGVPTLAWPEPPDPSHDYGLEISLTSADSAVATVSIAGVRVASTFTRQVWVRTALAYLAIVLFAGVLTALLRAIAKPAARWGMLTASTTSGVLGAVANSSFWPSLNVNPEALGGALLATLVALVVIGLLHPRAFNAISEHEPFAAISHYAFYLRGFRERYVAEYLDRLQRTIGVLRKNAFHEDYVRIPATLRSGGGAQAVSDEPELALARLLAAETNILIEAPGGMGKSALLRAVVHHLIQARRDQPDHPIPVLFESALPTTPGEIADRLFEKGELSARSLQVLSAILTYVVVFDGLVESNVAPAALDRLAYAPPGAPGRVRLLVSTRPQPLYEQTLSNCGPLTTVALSRISESRVRAFECACANALAAAMKLPAPGCNEKTGALSDTLRTHCVDKDGTYIPILIKLAVVVQEEVTSISGLYRLTLARLLKLDPTSREFADQLGEAGKLCAATYWREGLRALAFVGAPPQHRDLLSKLKAMSVVYSTEAGEHPREVRFFHDSMQSYLTAVALTTGAQDLEFLARAAGSEMFREGESGAELFRMCVGLIPHDQVAAYIDGSLTQWRTRFAGELAPNPVARAIPVRFQGMPADAAEDAVMPTADQLLRDAIARAKGAPAPEAAMLDLFEAVAPLFWPLLNRCYVDISTLPPGGEIAIDDVALGTAPLSYPYQVGKQLVVTATLMQDGRRLHGSSVTTVQRDQVPLVIPLRR